MQDVRSPCTCLHVVNGVQAKCSHQGRHLAHDYAGSRRVRLHPQAIHHGVAQAVQGRVHLQTQGIHVHHTCTQERDRGGVGCDMSRVREAGREWGSHAQT